jgi:hypothetical protein
MRRSDVRSIVVPVSVRIEPSPIKEISLLPVVVGPVSDIVVVMVSAELAGHIDTIAIISRTLDGLRLVRFPRVWANKLSFYRLHTLSSWDAWSGRLNCVCVPVNRYAAGTDNSKEPTNDKKQWDKNYFSHSFLLFLSLFGSEVLGTCYTGQKFQSSDKNCYSIFSPILIRNKIQ